jgi:pimeloyl-ACP methyl ester carboxylesterase
MSELVRDGVRLWYTEAGSGDPPLVFAHGWCCDHTYFQPQFDHFKSAHHVVAVDLRGHGQSDKPEQDYTVPGFADDLVWIARQLGLNRVVLVGHSLGGIAALEAGARNPDLVAAAILVDPAPVVRPPGLDDIGRAFIEELRGPNYAEAARQHVENVLFLPSDDPKVKGRITDAMCSVPQHVMAGAMNAIFTWDGEAAARRCAVPVLNISAANPIGDVPRFKELCPSLTTGQTVGSGHFNQLLVPEQVNSMIERFLEALNLIEKHREPALAGSRTA